MAEDAAPRVDSAGADELELGKVQCQTMSDDGARHASSADADALEVSGDRQQVEKPASSFAASKHSKSSILTQLLHLLTPAKPREFHRLMAVSALSIGLFCIPRVRDELGSFSWLVPYAAAKGNLGPQGFGFTVDRLFKFLVLLLLTCAMSEIAVWSSDGYAVVLLAWLFGWVYAVVLLSNLDTSWFGGSISACVFAYELLYDSFKKYNEGMERNDVMDGLGESIRSMLKACMLGIALGLTFNALIFPDFGARDYAAAYASALRSARDCLRQVVVLYLTDTPDEQAMTRLIALRKKCQAEAARLPLLLATARLEWRFFSAQRGLRDKARFGAMQPLLSSVLALVLQVVVDSEQAKQTEVGDAELWREALFLDVSAPGWQDSPSAFSAKMRARIRTELHELCQAVVKCITTAAEVVDGAQLGDGKNTRVELGRAAEDLRGVAEALDGRLRDAIVDIARSGSEQLVGSETKRMLAFTTVMLSLPRAVEGLSKAEAAHATPPLAAFVREWRATFPIAHEPLPTVGWLYGVTFVEQPDMHGKGSSNGETPALPTLSAREQLRRAAVAALIGSQAASTALKAAVGAVVASMWGFFPWGISFYDNYGGFAAVASVLAISSSAEVGSFMRRFRYKFAGLLVVTVWALAWYGIWVEGAYGGAQVQSVPGESTEAAEATAVIGLSRDGYVNGGLFLFQLLLQAAAFLLQQKRPDVGYATYISFILFIVTCDIPIAIAQTDILLDFSSFGKEVGYSLLATLIGILVMIAIGVCFSPVFAYVKISDALAELAAVTHRFALTTSVPNAVAERCA